MVNPSTFLQETENFSGLTDNSFPPLSFITEERINVECAIGNYRGMGDKKISEIVSAIALSNIPRLSAYVVKNYQSASENAYVLACTAALIRAEQIAQVAKSNGVSDIDALHLIEENESELLAMKLPDSEYVLTPELGAAIKIILEKMMKDGGCNTIKELLEILPEDADLRTICEPCCKYSCLVEFDPFYLVGDYNSFEGDNILPGEHEVQDETIFAGISNIIKAITGSVKKEAEDVITTSVDKSVKKNIPKIIGLILLLGATIFGAIYAAKRL